MRVYDYTYVPAGDAHEQFLRGERRAVGMLAMQSWDGSDAHGPDQFVILSVRVTDLCDACGGAGDRMPKVNRLKRVVCKVCKGNPLREVLPTIGGAQ